MAPALRAVVFDVDFTLARPGPDLGPEGYRILGLRYGLDLDPGRYDEARRAAVRALERHPELDHDEEIWVLFTERIMQGMGGRGDTRGAATEMTAAWSHAEHFELYDDALPTLELLRQQGLKLGLLSNTARHLPSFAAHHGLHADALLTSHAHGKEKPHASIFERMLGLLGVDCQRGGDGRRHARGRHRRGRGDRHARGARRPRPAIPGRAATPREPGADWPRLSGSPLLRVNGVL